MEWPLYKKYRTISVKNSSYTAINITWSTQERIHCIRHCFFVGLAYLIASFANNTNLRQPKQMCVTLANIGAIFMGLCQTICCSRHYYLACQCTKDLTLSFLDWSQVFVRTILYVWEKQSPFFVMVSQALIMVNVRFKKYDKNAVSLKILNRGK